MTSMTTITKVSLIILAFFITFILSCKKNTTEPQTSNYVKGKNSFVINLNGDDREYFEDVPVNYSGLSSTPVVFMLYGTSGNGEEFYNNSGWKEVGETENIFTVFPSSWS